MKKIMDYIDASLKDLPENEHLKNFKEHLLKEVTERTNEMIHAGLRDADIIDDILISEHQDLKDEYNQTVIKANKKKKRRTVFIIHTASSFVYLFSALLTFLGIGFVTHEWHPTWVILVGAVLMYFALLLLRYAIQLSKSDSIIMLQIPRFIFPGIIFLTATTVFLILRVVLLIKLGWLSFIAAVVVTLIVDGIYTEIKSEKFAIIFHILYIVPAFTMFYIMLGAAYVIPWHPGWIIIPASGIIAILVIIARLIIHSKNKEELEVEDQWKED